ncbi:hypothetical protein KR074_003176, partial [Drosophila pseudoananassae]
LSAIWTLLLVAGGLQVAAAQLANVCLNLENGSRLPLATHCARFVVCQNGEVSTIGSCPRGLHFNRELGECDFQWRANCLGLAAFAGPADQCSCDCCAEECSDSVDGNEETTSVTEDCDPATTSTKVPETEPTDSIETDSTDFTDSTDSTSDFDDTTNSSNTTPSPSQVAPSYCASSNPVCANQKTGSYIDIPGICVRYYQCSNGCAVEQTCPANTYFNPESNECDNWWNVDCTPTADASEEIEGPSGTTCSNHGVCYRQKDGEMFADSESNGFFVCQCQCPIAMTCPDELKFNEEAQVCDYPTDNDSASKTSKVLCPDNLVYNATSDQCDYPANYVPEVSCNTTDVTVCQGEPEGKLFPVEGKCNMFYKCNYNCAVEQYCPNNLIYDSTNEICNYPQNVECKWEYTPPSGPTAGPSGTACESNGRCLGQLEGTYLNSTTSCNGYVVCQCECEVEMSCPVGLYWDQTKKTCNYERNVTCTL